MMGFRGWSDDVMQFMVYDDAIHAVRRCPACGGSGWNPRPRVCTDCNGHGTQHGTFDPMQAPPLVRDAALKALNDYRERRKAEKTTARQEQRHAAIREALDE